MKVEKGELFVNPINELSHYEIEKIFKYGISTLSN